MIIVLHIPKAVGTTLRTFMWKHLAADRCFAVGNDIYGDMMRLCSDPETTMRMQVIFGHICHGWHKRLGVHAYYTTILRDPLDRVGSLYDFIRRGRNHYLHHLVSRMTFTEFMESGVTLTADNAMVRQLCGEDRFARSPYKDMNMPFGGVREYHLDMAISNLRDCMLVGVADRYQEYQNAMSDKMGWPREVMEVCNTTPDGGKTDMTPYRGMFNHRLELDYVLYEYALRIAT